MTFKTLKICHLADAHIGYRRFTKTTKNGTNIREQDVLNAFHEAISRVIEIKPEITIIAGDLFHTPRPSNANITAVFRELTRLSLGTKSKIVLISGNHDSPKRIETGSIYSLFREIDGVFVSDIRTEKFTFNDIGVSILAVPFPAVSKIKDQELLPDPTVKYNILVSHGQLAGVDARVEKQDFCEDQLNVNHWDYVALGHIHEYKEIGVNLVYSGALEHTTNDIWREKDIECGFVEVDLISGKRKHHKLNTARKIVELESIDCDGLMAMEVFEKMKNACEALSDGIHGKIIRLKIYNLSRETIRQLPFKEIRSLKLEAVGFIFDIQVKRLVIENSPEKVFYKEKSRCVTGLEAQLLNFIEENSRENKQLPLTMKKYINEFTVIEDEANSA